ncbi:bifunctional hydroxymethylpyrimidine kinase/phosphomethylpyrimidine kinase [Brevibacterium litoralis]|uniref:bifunctional hydroxymethylpyrimidine kinase/phosphomethylpyrimidine kinase n=1 Tax=Brevibacterium litoralis TaxID=3138935 RepID=UPI0032EEBDAE
MAPRALTVAGSDVSGGAGIAADLKMFEEVGVFGSSVITCIVTFDPAKEFEHAIEFFTPEVVRTQLDSALAIHEFDVIKSGMLGTVETALVLADRLQTTDLPYVLDPVLVCKGAGTMVDLKDLFVDNLVPHATVATPNLEEAATLAGIDPITDVAGMQEAARIIHGQGAKNVIVKGGARLAGDQAIDVIFDGTTFTRLTAPKVSDTMVNGAGCSFASAIAAGIATGKSVVDAAVEAKKLVLQGIDRSVENAIGVNSLLHPAARCHAERDLQVTVG